MAGWRISFFLIFVVGLMAILGRFIGSSNNRDSGEERSYKRLPPVVDPEHRIAPLDATSSNEQWDLTAFTGMPDKYKEAILDYTQAVFTEIGAIPLTRRRFYHQDRRGQKISPGVSWDPYPDDANPIYDKDVAVPIVALPRPDAVNQWSASTKARSAGWCTQNEAVEGRGSVYGRTLIFEWGKRSVNPVTVPACPFETNIPSWDLYVPEHDRSYFLELGKIVVEPCYNGPGRTLLDLTAELHLGEEEGAKSLGELVTVPACLKNRRLRWVWCQNGSATRQFLAYSLLDGNGAKRARRFQDSPDGPLSPYVRPLNCERHQPRIKQHDLLLQPTPLGWAPNLWDKASTQNPHEEWCLDDWFPAQEDACWVVRETEESKPLQESFSLMAARDKSDRPVFLVALFAETKPEPLLKELAALYKVSADSALGSPETMQRLHEFYEKVRDFPLSK